MRLCKDCEYSRGSDFYLLKCQRPTGISPVDGNMELRDRYCSNERDIGWINSRVFGYCGKEGRYFEGKNIK